MMRPDCFKVKGRGIFPFDMLRYDRCFPATERDSHAIQENVRRWRSSEDTVVTLTMADPKRLPTEARWESFGWKVLDD